MIGGVVLDASSLADLAENRTPRAAAVVDTAIANLRVVCVPAAALMECWARLPESSQAFLVMFTSLPVVVVDPADETAAIDAGALAAAAGQPGADAGTMQAVHAARTRQWPILTARPQDVKNLNPGIIIQSLP